MYVSEYIATFIHLHVYAHLRCTVVDGYFFESMKLRLYGTMSIYETCHCEARHRDGEGIEKIRRDVNVPPLKIAQCSKFCAFCAHWHGM